MGPGLRGFVAQGMDGRKAAINPVSASFPAGSWVFTPSHPGRFKFICWGPGGNANASAAGASGGYSEITRPLTPGQPVTIVVGRAGSTDTTLSFTDGKIVTVTRASNAVPGTATGGDVNINGTAGGAGSGIAGAPGSGTGGGGGGAGSGSADGGAGAPGVLPYRGGPGGAGGVNNPGCSPGGGAGQSAPGLSAWGADGLVLVQELSIRR